MNEKYVTSLSLSKELKEAGAKQESEFVWNLGIFGKWELKILSEVSKEQYRDRCSAYLTGEILEVLPWKIKQRAIGEGEHGGVYYLYTGKAGNDDFYCFYAMNNGQTRLHYFESDILSEAPGKMLLYLLKQGVVK